MSHTIELKKVSKYYAGEDSVSMGLSRLDLGLDMGEFVAITGESGGGKSTLLNVISGLDTYEEGEMFVCGEDTAAYNIEDYERYRKTYIGNIFQDFNLVNSYSVYQNIELVMLLCGKKKSECKARITELIELVGLTEFTRTKASKLSGGQKQRVAIARALAKDAPIIVADEPTGNLDSESAALVMEILARVSADKLVVIVTHNYEQAEKYVTRKLTMHDGRIIEDRKLESEYRKSLTSAAAETKTAVAEGALSAPEMTAEAETAAVDEEGKGSKSADGDKTLTKGDKPLTDRDKPQTDGDKPQTDDSEQSEATEISGPEYKDMRKGSEIRLGLRNSFNIPSKFILLFIVYLFVATAVIGQYSSVKNSLYEDEQLGYNDYFSSATSDRIVLTKKDGSTFTDRELKKLKKTENIDRVVTNDALLDDTASFSINDTWVYGPIMPATDIKADELKYGRLPEKDNEIVVECDLYSDAYTIFNDNGEDVLGTKVYIDNNNGEHFGTSKFEICGIIISDEENDNSVTMGYSYIYVTEKMNTEVLSDYVASTANVDITYNKTKISYDYGRQICRNSEVPEGQMYVFEEEAIYLGDKESEKSISVEVENSFFTDSKSFKLGKTVKESAFEKTLGIPQDEYDMYIGKVFVNPEDYRDLFEKGNFQISVFVKEESKLDDTVELLGQAGYKTLALRDTLTDVSGGFNFVIQLMSFGLLILELILLFFIAYAVIRLIMRSRNSYYSTLRILGASKKNTDVILKIELVLMMVIAYITDMVLVLLINFRYIDVKMLRNQLSFVTITDYIILAVVLIAMSVLISDRYSRRIFRKSAMKTYREEV